MQRITLFALAASIGISAAAQNKTKDGYSLSWDKEITTTIDTVRTDSLKVPATRVPIYEARPSDVTSMLRTLLPGASFKESKGVYTAPGVSVPSLSPTPVDLLATMKEDKKAGVTMLSLGFLKDRAPIGDAGVQQSAVRDLAVKLNKAVVEKQVTKWEELLTKAAKNTESAKADQNKANKRVSSASSDLEKTATKKSKVQRDIANNQADIARLEQRWQASQDAKDLKKLTKLRGTQTKNEKKLADLMADESKEQKTLNKHQDSLPDAAKDRGKREDQQHETQRTVDALKRKLENIR